MLPEQTIHSLHKLHEERLDLVIQYKDAQRDKRVMSIKESWYVIFWFLGIPLFLGIGSQCLEPLRTIEQRVFWIVVVIGIIVWSIISFRRLHEQEDRSIQQSQEAFRKLEQLVKCLRSFNPPLLLRDRWL
jgi:hypothetical protein